jgi:3-oxoacyl-[acyl-carrier protein] reductase
MMDLGIAGKWAIVCASSKGLGYGCAISLAREGVNLVMNARTADTLEQAAARVRAETGVQVRTVACDITTAAGRAEVLAACPQVDILVNNAGGPPPGDFRDWGRDDWIKALDGNMLTPIELIKAVVDGMIARGFGRIVNITSSSVKAPIDVLGLSNGARSGLTGFVAGVARTTVKHNVTINNLLPGVFDTDRIQATLDSMAKKMNVSKDEAMKRRVAAIPAGRMGTPMEFGQACAYLCSMQAAYVTGQNFLIDGGAYPGTY